MEDETIVVPQRRTSAQPPANVVLEPLNGTFERAAVSLREPLKLGRVGGMPAGPSTLLFTSKVVSRSHAEIFMQDGKVFVRDLGSTSGTYVNERKINRDQPVELRNDDRLQLGNNYSDNAEKLRAEPELRCVQARLVIRGLLEEANSSPGSTATGVGVNLTQLVGAVSISSSSPTPQAAASLLERKMSHPNAMAPHLMRSDSGLRSSQSDLRIDMAGLVRHGSASSIETPRDPRDRETYTLSITREKFILTKVLVQCGGKDAMQVNVRAWSTSRKLLVQDLRPSSMPNFEVIMDPSSKDLSRYTFVNLNGNVTVGSVEKKGTRSAFIEVVEQGRRVHASGDFDGSFALRNAVANFDIGEVVEIETTRKGGSYQRNVHVHLDKDAASTMVLAGIIVLILLVE